MTYATDLVLALQEAYRPLADPVRAIAMRAYMRDQFPFLGLPSTPRRAATRAVFAAHGRPSERDLAEAALALWELPEREYQYAACELIGRNIRHCGPELLPTARALIVSKSWWDTVDTLAADVVGRLVLPTPTLATEMDRWLEDEHLWLRRTAIIHQLRFREATDVARLERYCLASAVETDFFIRKAIGWALREYSKTDPRWVTAFVAEHRHELSPLSRTEALKWLSVRESGRRAAEAEGIAISSE